MWTAIAAGIIALIAGAFGITVYAKNRRISELETDKRNLSIGKAYAEEEAKKQSQRADAAEAGKDLNVRIASALRNSPSSGHAGTGDRLSEEDKRNAENIMSRDITH